MSDDKKQLQINAPHEVLPAYQPLTKLDQFATEEQVKSQDIQIIGSGLELLNKTLYQLQNEDEIPVDTVCKLGLTISKMLETRRKLMNHKLGAPIDHTPARSPFDVLE